MTTANDKVLDHTRLQLSALFDGELALDEARFLERRLQHDDELAGCVSSWQLAGDILRGQPTAAAPAGFAAQVAAALAAEARQAAPATVARRSRSRWGSGAALAASVAAIALFMARQSPEALPVDTAAQIEIASTAPARPAPRPQSPAPDAAAQLAAATVAVAEVPRRVAARRAASSRGQAQRAATTRVSRALDDAAAQPQLAVASAAPGAIDASAINPFMPDATASTSGQRPWPRALLPNAGAAFNVGYGNLQPTAMPADPAAHPFRPRPVRVQQAPVAESIPTTP
jgi:negative regulator of sigma E activity